MPKSLKFLMDPYDAQCKALVKDIVGRTVVLDRTIFYPATGISPSDVGWLTLADGTNLSIERAVWLKGPHVSLGHQLSGGPLPSVGDEVQVKIDWPLRHRRMRVHTGLHLISVCFPYTIVGGHIGNGEGFIEFETDSSGMDRLTLDGRVKSLIARSSYVASRWIEKPDAPPKAHLPFDWPGYRGLVRAIEIVDLDLQICDGLHVRNTCEIGKMFVKRVEQIGANRRRVWIGLLPTLVTSETPLGAST